MDLRRLRYFVAVAEELHYGRAAARLHMSTPPLSQRIRELEVELGVVLFERSSRRVVITPAGRRLLAEAGKVLAAADLLLAVAEEESVATRAAVGPLALAYCHGSEGVALAAARRFRERHPEIAVHPAALTSLRTFDELRAGRLTVGIVRPPTPSPARLTSRLLCRVAFDHLAVPEAHPLAQSVRISARDLEGQPVLLVERAGAPVYHDASLAYCSEHGVRPEWVVHPVSQVERMLDMVAVGSGIGWLNAWQARQPPREGVVIRPLHPVTRFDEFLLVWRVDDRSAALTDFIDAATEVAEGTGVG